MRLIWENAALADREEIGAYIARDNPRAALKLDALFVQQAALLAQFPHMGHRGRARGTREWAVGSYILVYETTQDTVRISRVRHVARRWL